jgi:hypothetical protein
MFRHQVLFIRLVVSVLSLSGLFAKNLALAQEIPVIQFEQKVEVPGADGQPAETVVIQQQVASFEAGEEAQAQELLEKVLVEASEQDVNVQVVATSLDHTSAHSTEVSTEERGENLLKRAFKQARKRGAQFGAYVQRSFLKHPTAPKIQNAQVGKIKINDVTSTLMTISRFVIPGVLTYVGLNVTTDIPPAQLLAYSASVFSASTLFALNAKRVNNLQGKGRIWSRDRIELEDAYRTGRTPELKILNQTDFISRDSYLAKQAAFVRFAVEGSETTEPMKVKDRSLGKGKMRVITETEALEIFRVSEEIYSSRGRVKNFVHGIGNFLALEYVFASIFIGVYYQGLDLDAFTGKGFSLGAFLLGGLATTKTQGVVEQALVKFRDVARKSYGWSQAQIDAYFVRTSALASIASVSAYAVLDAVPELSILGWGTLGALGVGGSALLLRTTLHSKSIESEIKGAACDHTFKGRLPESLPDSVPDAA